MTAPLPAPSASPSEAARETWLAPYADVLRQWLADGRRARLPLSGISMEPTIWPGARLVLDGGAPAVADLVVYEDTDRLICHRVLRRRHVAGGPELLTKGDRLRVPPVWVDSTKVIGRVVAIETGARLRRLTDSHERLRAQLATGRSWLAVLGRSFVRALR
jgi:hypothetical protein